MAVTFFGQCDSSGNPTANNSQTGFNYDTDGMVWTEISFTCPGSGDQTIRQMSGYVWNTDGSGSSARFGVYDASGNLVVDCGTASISISAAGWTSVGDGSTSNLGTLTGGTNYRLGVALISTPSTYILFANTTGTFDEGSFQTGTDYGSGMPDPFPTTTVNTQAIKHIIRVGVEPAAVGQFARPATTTVSGNWDGFIDGADQNDSSNLDNYIDETTADDTDSIRSGTAPDNDSCTVTLSSVTAPGPGTVTMRIRARFL